MKKYKVRAKLTTYATIEVDAANAEDAMQIAQGIDGGCFVTEPEDTGDWVILSAQEVLEPEEGVEHRSISEPSPEDY